MSTQSLTRVLAILAVSFTFAACGSSPDLVVDDVSVTWNKSHRNVVAKVRNAGGETVAGPVSVNIAVTEPGGSEIVTTCVMYDLGEDGSKTCGRSFGSFASKSPTGLNGATEVKVTVDSLGEISEEKEDNNSKVVSLAATPQ